MTRTAAESLASRSLVSSGVDWRRASVPLPGQPRPSVSDTLRSGSNGAVTGAGAPSCEDSSGIEEEPYAGPNSISLFTPTVAMAYVFKVSRPPRPYTHSHRTARWPTRARRVRQNVSSVLLRVSRAHHAYSTARINKLCYGLDTNHLEPIEVSRSVASTTAHTPRSPSVSSRASMPASPPSSSTISPPRPPRT